MSENTGPMKPQTIPEDYVSKDETNPQTEKANKGMATDYWLELVAYPTGAAKSLWLRVDGCWCHHHHPDEGTQKAVLEAFTNSDKHQIQVWYRQHRKHGVVVGLVVCSS